jgi:enoyl-CoA hydratase/carnithine racemase
MVNNTENQGMNATPASTEVSQEAVQDEVLFRVVSHVAIVTLNRPAALNALTHAMVGTIAGLLERVQADDDIVALVLNGAGPKGFCAGGDVRAIYQQARRGERLGETGWQQFFVDEYRLDHALHTFSKPVVALLDGVTMGGGMGLGQGAALRVATSRTKIAMPETRIGLLPDVGATHFLAVMPVETELYVGLTGVALSGTDAVHCGLADICVPGEWLDGFEARLEQAPLEGDVHAALLRVFDAPCHHTQPGALETNAPLIAQYFERRRTVEQIVEALQTDLASESGASDAQQAWRRATLDALTHYSPTMLEVTREALLRGRQMTLAESFRMELGIVARAIEEGDFCEGVRAHLVDKDRKPRWAPATLAELRPERIQHLLTSPWRGDAHPLAGLGA